MAQDVADGSDEAGEAAAHVAQGAAVVPGSGILTFLIADIRGYTTFTRERGDEAAARLAAQFAASVESVVPAYEGHVVELRGDEALVVFTSARQALRAAVAMQRVFAVMDDECAGASALPVGIGLDAGEAVPFRGGFRGSSLNMAARLCSAAAAGQILATAEVVHLATRVAGIRFLAQGPMQLKGVVDPVHVIAVESDELPQVAAIGRGSTSTSPSRPRRRAARDGHRWTAATVLAAVALVVAVGTAAWVLWPTGDGRPAPEPDTLPRLDLAVSTQSDARALAVWLITHMEETIYVDVTIDTSLVNGARRYMVGSAVSTPDHPVGIDADMCEYHLESAEADACHGDRFPGEGYVYLFIRGEDSRSPLFDWIGGASGFHLRGFLRPVDLRGPHMGQYTLVVETRTGARIPPSTAQPS